MNNILILGDFNFHFDSNEIHHAKFKKNYAFIILNNHHFYLIILLLNVTLIFNILLLEKLFHTDVLKNNYEEFEWDLTELTLPTTYYVATINAGQKSLLDKHAPIKNNILTIHTNSP